MGLFDTDFPSSSNSPFNGPGSFFAGIVTGILLKIAFPKIKIVKEKKKSNLQLVKRNKNTT